MRGLGRYLTRRVVVYLVIAAIGIALGLRRFHGL